MDPTILDSLTFHYVIGRLFFFIIIVDWPSLLYYHGCLCACTWVCKHVWVMTEAVKAAAYINKCVLYNCPELWQVYVLREYLTASLANDMKPMRLFHTRLMSFSCCCSFSELTAVALMPSSTRLVTRYTSTTPDEKKTYTSGKKKTCFVALFVLSPFLWHGCHSLKADKHSKGAGPRQTRQR